MSATPPPDPPSTPVRHRVPPGLIPKVLILLGAFVAILVAVGFALPTRYTVERSAVVAAPPARIWPLVGDFAQWPAWQPWAARDGEATFTAHGAPGVGQRFEWLGARIGQGQLEVTAIEDEARLEMRMDFRQGGPAPVGTLRLEATADGATRVVWRVEGETAMRPIGNYLGLLMDGIVGPDLADGLARLKAAAEAPAP